MTATLPEDRHLAFEERVPSASMAREGYALWPSRLEPGIHDRIRGLCRRAVAAIVRELFGLQGFQVGAELFYAIVSFMTLFNFVISVASLVLSG